MADPTPMSDEPDVIDEMADRPSAERTVMGPPRAPSASHHGTVTSDMNDGDVACDCGQGRPNNGEAAILCVVCQRWNHVACKIGSSPEATDHGKAFTCQPCRASSRSESAKRVEPVAAPGHAPGEETPSMSVEERKAAKIAQAVAASQARRLVVGAGSTVLSTPLKHIHRVEAVSTSQLTPAEGSENENAEAGLCQGGDSMRTGDVPRITGVSTNRDSLKRRNRRRVVDDDNEADDEGDDEDGEDTNARPSSYHEQSSNGGAIEDQHGAVRLPESLTPSKINKQLEIFKRKRSNRDDRTKGERRRFGPRTAPPPAKRQRNRAQENVSPAHADISDTIAVAQPPPEQARKPHHLQPAARPMPPGLQELLGDWEARGPPEQPDMSCDCGAFQAGHPTAAFDFLICSLCFRMQHTGCMLGANDREVGVHGLLCKPCRRNKVREQYLAQQRAVDFAAAAVHEESIRLSNFCRTYLWRHYCLLPPGRCSAAVREATSTVNHPGGRIEPRYPAPPGWTGQMLNRIQTMIMEAGEAKESEFFGRGIRYDRQYVVALSHMALWMLREGKYKGNRGQLGLLAEVVGLAEKGTIWDGR